MDAQARATVERRRVAAALTRGAQGEHACKGCELVGPSCHSSTRLRLKRMVSSLRCRDL